MSPKQSVHRAIARANAILPGKPKPDPRESDPRWQAIIEIGHFVESHPEPIWSFVLRWGKHPQADLRMALAVCLLEHLLEYHFGLMFPRVRQVAKSSPRFAWMVKMVALHGQATRPNNRARIRRLQRSTAAGRRKKSRRQVG